MPRAIRGCPQLRGAVEFIERDPTFRDTNNTLPKCNQLIQITGVSILVPYGTIWYRIMYL